MSHVIYTPVINGDKSVFAYKNDFLSKELAEKTRSYLNSLKYRDGHCISGKRILRQQLWFQKDKQYFCDKWKNRFTRWESVEEYPSILKEIELYLKINIDKFLKDNNISEYPIINSCLINKYRDGNDSIRAHRDTPHSFGDTPVIFGLSFGNNRLFRVRRLFNPDSFKSLKVDKQSSENIDFTLEDNSLFIMAGHSQKYFSHEIPKMDNENCGVRYSMTFREFIS